MRRVLYLTLCLAFVFSATAFAGEAKEKISLGFVYVSPVGNEGFSFSHDQARKKLEEDPNITTSLVESVAEGADAERVILNMARKKTDIIVATSFGFMEAVLKVAKQYPDLTFLHCSGIKTADNVSNFFGRIYQARYLSGMVAGRMSKSNIIGYVAAYPIPEVVRGINAFTLGVKEVNPEAEVRVVWTKTWYDPVTEKVAGESLVDVGADVLTQHQDSPGTQEAAAARGVYSIGYHSDMSAFAPGKHLVAAVWNWLPFYEDVIAKVRKGEWKSGSYWLGMETGVVDLSAFGEAVPEEVRQEIAQRKAEIISGDYVVFKGPVKNQEGKVAVAEGDVPSDKELLSMNWFVEGVVGSPK